MKNIRIFYLKIFIILVVKFSVYLNRPVFVMRSEKCWMSFSVLMTLQNKTKQKKKKKNLSREENAIRCRSRFTSLCELRSHNQHQADLLTPWMGTLTDAFLAEYATDGSELTLR